MRDRMERLVVHPFFIGCTSQSSVAVIETHSKKSKPRPNPSALGELEGEESLSSTKMKNTVGFPALPKPNISSKIERLIKNLKTPQSFVDKEDVSEMHIGVPTEVKHVTHIGWDSSPSTTPLKGLDNLRANSLLSFPNLSKVA